MRQIWDSGLNIDSESSMFNGYFSTIHSQNLGQMYRLKLDYWQLKPAIVDSSIDWFYCPTCNRITLHNVKGTCPTYQCSGRLEKCSPEKLYKNNHYRNLYLDKLPVKMKSKEHTAQLTTEAAADIQSRFNNGDVNVLSCSTTFELGVDVGELESVFMRNVPPTPANYIQRAGRAGRRTDSTAFSLTFARRRSHDLTYFQNPLDIISGNIEPPHFKIKNDKIIRRHIYAAALANFWREHAKYFGAVEDFFFSDGIDKFYRYLKEKPIELKIILEKIMPDASEIDLDNWKWINKLIGEKGVMNLARLELENDIEQLEKVQANLVEQKKFGKANVINRVN
ncbi:Helicase conserved C-terminal domain-containing protein [Halanaerobium congolense]|uniref:Helicase conserved C-terminal domain-containing protein n=2 Tax=Halanaerobium congolense TaxID=54121 RepID=A0A1M7N495_9FIRM|nr:helicase-related protein [Halanaerobium congolense]TDX39627.1 helicase-like protein [Halanaerobium congolense]SDF84991.1 Helicase conserved C-terminal domain-containing protein [Halanaerobium congolense]SET12789.1 Helicase conserved C-terminal domain-containing protein [Halanaerobium congolense]SFP54496.1 Helicase conserved C-terminal domain-containing protein [Halanaerobium congolense]SHM98198.1 Helicase conserved C-terminal domain-containing protein [Halanaerobium congolense]